MSAERTATETAMATIFWVAVVALVVTGTYSLGYAMGEHDGAVEELHRIKESRCLSLLMAPAGEPPKKIEAQP